MGCWKVSHLGTPGGAVYSSAALVSDFCDRIPVTNTCSSIQVSLSALDNRTSRLWVDTYILRVRSETYLGDLLQKNFDSRMAVDISENSKKY